MSQARIVRNPLRGAFSTDDPSRAALEFHRRLRGYTPTPLVDAPSLAHEFGLGRVLVKDEASRLGLPAFKILGASWASYRAVVERLGHEPTAWTTIDELAEAVAGLRPLVLTAATDGNHGRAVARMARLLGFGSHIFVPAGTAAARIDAIASEGAAVTVVDGTYDDAVSASAAQSGDRCLVISDTSWPGYEDVPRWVVDGYSTIFWEVDDEAARRAFAPPDAVFVPIGVGALAAAAVRHYRRRELDDPPMLVGVEPVGSDCMLASVEAGRIVTIPGPHDSIMVGLNCGMPSLIAWPIVSAGIDWFCVIADERSEAAMRALAGAGVVSGETGAATLGGLAAVCDDDAMRTELQLGPSSTVLLLSTEGATDPDNYERIVGRRP